MLRTGDLVKLDLVAEKDGFYADSAVTVAVGEVSDVASALVRSSGVEGPRLSCEEAEIETRNAQTRNALP